MIQEIKVTAKNLGKIDLWYLPVTGGKVYKLTKKSPGPDGVITFDPPVYTTKFGVKFRTTTDGSNYVKGIKFDVYGCTEPITKTVYIQTESTTPLVTYPTRKSMSVLCLTKLILLVRYR